MSKEMPLVLYAGEEKRGQHLQRITESLGWTVLTATEERQALGMYVFYLPDLIIIDSQYNEEGAKAVLFHLRSVQAQPVLFLVTPRSEIAVPSDRNIEVIPSTTEDSMIVLAAAQLMQMAEMVC
ncbi:MAG: hypothetical protein KF893_24925 [Caldilineaceae bacterium]|nr:hypothetical protein [Caldilineaceae bacterium]